jgi:hypothetical protein
MPCGQGFQQGASNFLGLGKIYFAVQDDDRKTVLVNEFDRHKGS